MQSYKLRGFTLLEVLMVIAIIAILGGLIIFMARPSDLLTDTNNAKRDAEAGTIEQALEAYAAFNTNGEKYPPELQNLPSGVYDICKEGQSSCSGNSVNIDTLIEQGFLAQVPVSSGCSSSTDSCYNIKSVNNGQSLKILADSEVLICPTGYVEVPGNSTYSTNDFCVMKYEAKDVGGVATSQAASLPWRNISQTNAITECTDLGSKYHLMTNNEWMTIARNIEQVANNWTDNVVGGSGKVYTGNVGNPPGALLAASTDDNDGYYGTGYDYPGSDYRRTLYLSNNNVIWDLVANASEMLATTITCAGASCTNLEMPFDASPASEWVFFSNISTYGQLSYDLVRPSNPSWDYLQGMGKVYTSTTTGTHTLQRGGNRVNQGLNGLVGLYTLDMSLSPSSTGGNMGFRCVYSN